MFYLYLSGLFPAGSPNSKPINAVIMTITGTVSNGTVRPVEVICVWMWCVCMCFVQGSVTPRVGGGNAFVCCHPC